MKKRKIKRHCVHDRNTISLWKLVWVLHHQPTTTLYPFKLSNVRVRLTQWNRWRQNEKLLCFGFEHHCLHSSSSSFFYFFSPAFISDLTTQRCLRLSDSNLWLCDDLSWTEQHDRYLRIVWSWHQRDCSMQNLHITSRNSDGVTSATCNEQPS